MKHAIIIPDGATDEPLDALDGRTPLQAAELPALDSLAAQGRLGVAVVAGEPHPGQAATLLSVLGYNPQRYPAGEGALTAHLQQVEVSPDDQTFRCNLVTALDGYLRDFTAGFISEAEALPLVETLNHAFSAQGFRFYPCGGYRNICVWQHAGDLHGLATVPPDRILHQPARRHMPPGSDSRPLFDLMMAAENLLRDHDINLVRQDLGESPANAIWLWGHGPLPGLPPFQQRYGLCGALVAGDHVARAIGQRIGWDLLHIKAATGLPDTDYAAKGSAAVDVLDTHDLVCVHVQSPHILGTLGNAAGKVSALEAIDRQIVAPLLERLQSEDTWRILIISPRPGSTAAHAETAGHAHFVFAGSGVESHRGVAFDEENAADGELHPDRASDLMEYFLRR